jgi:hypothetical protein
MPIPPPSNPLIDLYYQNNEGSSPENLTREDMHEMQRENDARLLGTFFVQAIFLALAIMLHETWEWSQFNEAYESAIFYGMFAFTFQAGLYWSYRVLYEDQSNHRKEMRRMRNKQKRSMAKAKMQMQKQQLDYLQRQQQSQLQHTIQVSMADNYVSPQEHQLIQQDVAALNQTNQQLAAIDPSLSQQIDVDTLARQLGVDRFRVGPIPLGPKLTLNQIPTTPMTTTMPQPENKLNLNPSGANEES